MLRRSCTCGKSVMPSGKNFQGPTQLDHPLFCLYQLDWREEGERELLSFAQRTKIDLDLMFAKWELRDKD